MVHEEKLLNVLQEHRSLGIADQIDYQKFYLYSLITHSTAIEGSTVTEIENQLLFDEGISAKGRTIQEQMMNLDLKAAYEHSLMLARRHTDFSVEMLKELRIRSSLSVLSCLRSISATFGVRLMRSDVHRTLTR